MLPAGQTGRHIGRQAATSRLSSTGRCIIQPRSANINEGFLQPSAVLAAVEISTQLCCSSLAPGETAARSDDTPGSRTDFFLCFAQRRHKKGSKLLQQKKNNRGGKFIWPRSFAFCFLILLHSRSSLKLVWLKSKYNSINKQK